MIWTIDWGIVFRRQLLEIPSPEAAGRLCETIMHFAETSKGLTQYDPTNPRRLKVRVPGAVAYLFADERAGVLHARRVYRRAT
jgi:hypothetical protein